MTTTQTTEAEFITETLTRTWRTAYEQLAAVNATAWDVAELISFVGRKQGLEVDWLATCRLVIALGFATR